MPSRPPLALSLVRNYWIDAFIGGDWRTVERVPDNRRGTVSMRSQVMWRRRSCARRRRTDAKSAQIVAVHVFPADVWLHCQLEVSADPRFPPLESINITQIQGY